MVTIIGVRFKKAGKIYYFDPAGEQFCCGQGVIVETIRGIEYGTVVIANRIIDENTFNKPVKKIIRGATERDDEINAYNKEREKEAFDICIDAIKRHGLDMKLIKVEFTFDVSKIIFYFTADGRIDFRELVKDLASVFHTRIELRQIGVRDEAKMVSGIGSCGRSLCCATFLGDFQPVSIKMAKDQNLSLNPSKISGNCGSLMCCLKYEEDVYKELNKNMPKEGDLIETDMGEGEVLAVNVLRGIIKAAIREEENDNVNIAYFSADEVKIIHKRRGRADG
ncbi:MAG: stage 0 sporulation family protein [Clostridiales bacterium]|nr:stage 0 sporulation family protein [Clostridiales bacterium]